MLLIRSKFWRFPVNLRLFHHAGNAFTLRLFKDSRVCNSSDALSLQVRISPFYLSDSLSHFKPGEKPEDYDFIQSLVTDNIALANRERLAVPPVKTSENLPSIQNFERINNMAAF